jgi:hypothetical protein
MVTSLAKNLTRFQFLDRITRDFVTLAKILPLGFSDNRSLVHDMRVVDQLPDNDRLRTVQIPLLGIKQFGEPIRLKKTLSL